MIDGHREKVAEFDGRGRRVTHRPRAVVKERVRARWRNLGLTPRIGLRKKTRHGHAAGHAAAQAARHRAHLPSGAHIRNIPLHRLTPSLQKEDTYLTSPALIELDRRVREQVQIGNMYIDLIEDKLRQAEAELLNS